MLLGLAHEPSVIGARLRQDLYRAFDEMIGNWTWQLLLARLAAQSFACDFEIAGA